MSKEIEKKLRRIINEVVDLGDSPNIVGLEDDLSKAGLDSINFIKMALLLEAEFDIEFDGENLDIHKFKNLQSLISYIEDKYNQI